MAQSRSDSKTDREKEAGNRLVYSYLTLRNLIGFCGILLPFVLMLATKKGKEDRFIEPSISDYYYSSNGDVFVVLLSVLGVFLFTYKGYKWQENLLTTLAAICALGVAFDPIDTSSANTFSIHVAHTSGPYLFGVQVHFIYAALFFLLLALISLLYFPLTDQEHLLTPEGKRTPKAKRNIVFKVCGWTIIACLILLGFYFAFEEHLAGFDFPFVFILETIAVEAFGISWITKGQTLWPDQKHYLTKAYQELTKP